MTQNGKAKPSANSIQIILRKKNDVTYDFLLNAALKIDLDNKAPRRIL